MGTTFTPLQIAYPVEQFGAKGDGVTDDTAAIQRAINAVAGTYKTLWLSRTYKITSAITCSTGGFSIDGGGTLRPAGNSISYVPLLFTGSESAITTVTVDVNGNFAGRFTNTATSITVASTTGMAVGSYLLLVYNSSSTRFFAQIAQISSIAGSVVSFNDTIYIPMDHTQSGTVAVLNLVMDVHVRNLIIDGTLLTGTYPTTPMVEFATTAFCSAENIKIVNMPNGSGSGVDGTPLMFQTGYGNYANNITDVSSGGHNGSVWFNWQTALQTDNLRSFSNSSRSDSHGITFQACTDSQIGKVISNGHAGRGVRVLMCAQCRFDTVSVNNNGDNGIFVTWNSYQIYFREILASNNTTTDGLVYGGDNEDYIVIDRFVGFNNGGNQISDLTTTTHSRVNQYLSTAMPAVGIQNVLGMQDNLLTGTPSGGAITLNGSLLLITTESLSTAAGSTATITLTDSRIIGSGHTHVVATIDEGGSNTQGVPVMRSATMGAGSCTIRIYNAHASQAFNGTLILHVQILPIG